MTYEITKSIRIRNYEDDWDYNFKTDEYGTVDVTVGVDDGIHIPKDCIQHFIDALEQFK
tara:strand:+ start:368 stop:544 length:177 start_codon:yes stop_codon:yes gene_type:complete